MNRRVAIWLLLLVSVVSVAAVLIPAWLIYPFRSQSPGTIELSYYLRKWSPALTTALLAVSLFLVLRLRAGSTRTVRRLLLVAFLVIAASTWFAFQNHFEWMFGPLPDPAYAEIDQADFIKAHDMVLTVNVDGDTAAYPVRLLAYHHLVHDNVGGKAIIATY